MASGGASDADIMADAGGGSASHHLANERDSDRPAASQDNDLFDNDSGDVNHQLGQQVISTKRTTSYVAFINKLRDYGLELVSMEEWAGFLKTIFVGLKSVIKYDFGKSIKLSFHDEVSYKDAFKRDRFTFKGREIRLHQPNPDSYQAWGPRDRNRTTLFIFGLDEDVPQTELDKALKEHGMNPVSRSKFCFYKSAPTVMTGGRSVVVDTDINFTIPARLTIEHPYLISGKVVVKIWFVGQQAYCPFCKIYGHNKNLCEVFPKMNPQDTLFTMKNKTNFEKICDIYNMENFSELKNVRYPEGVDQEKLPDVLKDGDITPFEMLLSEREKGNDSCFMVAEKNGGIIPFYKAHEDNGKYSNLAPLQNPISCGEYSFNTVEKGLLVFRTEAAGNLVARDQILKEDKLYNMAKLAGDVVWPGSYFSYVKYSFNVLYALNRAKYKADDQLFSDFISTTGRFTECNTGRTSIWSCCTVDVDPLIKDSTNWVGPNLFGDLLTMLRSHLMDEYKVSKGQDIVPVGSKRGYQPSGYTPPPPTVLKNNRVEVPELLETGDKSY